MLVIPSVVVGEVFENYSLFLLNWQKLEMNGTIFLVNAECGVSPSAGARDHLSPGSHLHFISKSRDSNIVP